MGRENFVAQQAGFILYVKLSRRVREAEIHVGTPQTKY